MGDYKSVTIFDPFGDSMELCSQRDSIRVKIIQEDLELKFFADTDKQSDIIQHFIKYNPGCKDLALNRMSYELLTLKANFDRLISVHKDLREEYEILLAKHELNDDHEQY